MAVYAAHLTRTLQGTPSVFQLTAQEALGTTIKPALKKVVEYLATTYPNKCDWCLRWYDELYLLFDCSLQYHYLKHYAASFSESFYGLLRVPTVFNSEFSTGQRLPVWLERGSVVLLVLIPYVRDKAEQIVDKWREDDEDGRLGKNTPDRLRKSAIRIYSILHLVCEGVKLIQLGRYLTGAAPSHSPSLAVLGLTLKDAPPAEPADDDYTWADLVNNLLTGQIGSAEVTFPMVGAAALRATQYAAFGVQFLRWWESRAALSDTAALPVPPAPQREECEERALRCRNKCPLCLRSWRAPTALPVSGYIFCYVCISRHVRAHAACPVTRCAAAERSLLRLYLE